MKHLLILVSILLLSSFITSCEKKEGTLYLWETSSGKVWKEFGDKETHPKYEGDVENGKPNGLGIFIYPNGNKYVGEWKDGKRNGQGTLTISPGWKYVGSWKDGVRNGQGTYTSPGGHKYVGEYKDDKEWNGNDYNKNGNFTGKFVNGEYIKQ